MPDAQPDDPMFTALGIRTPQTPVQQDGQPATVPPEPPAGAPQTTPIEQGLGIKLDDTRSLDTPPSDQRLPFLSRAFHSLYGAGSALAHDVVRDLTPSWSLPTSESQPAPGLTSGPGPATALGLVPSPPPGVSTDLSKSSPFMAGVGRGVQDVGDTAHRAYTYTTGSPADYDALRQQQKQDDQQFDKDFGHSTSANLGRATGQFLATSGPLGLAGRAISGAIELPGLVGSAAPDVLRWITGADRAATTGGRAVQAGIQGAATGAGTTALTGDDVGAGTAAGAVLGPVGAGIGKVVDAARGYIPGITDTIANLAAQAQARGIFPDVGKFSDNPFLRIVQGQLRELPWSGATTRDLANRRTIQGQLISEMGDTSGSQTFSDNLMRQNATRLGNTRDAILNRSNITMDNQLAQDLSDITTAVQGSNPNVPRYSLTADQRNAVNTQIQNVVDGFRNGTMTGQGFQNLTRSDGPLQALIDGGGTEGDVFGTRLKRVLDDAFTRSNPDAADAYRLNSYQYRAMKTLEPLVNKSTAGDISLPQLQQQVINQSKKYDSSNWQKAYTGGGPMGTLGDISKQFFTGEPQSGTAPRQFTLGLLMRPWEWPGAVATGGLLGVNALGQRALNSPSVQRNMVQTSLGTPVPDIMRYVPPLTRAGIAYGNQTVPNQ